MRTTSPRLANAFQLPYDPHYQQIEVHQALADYRFVTVVAHRRWGKTECAVACLVVGAAAHPGNDGQFAYIAPFLKQAKQIAWRKLKRYVAGTFGRNWRKNGCLKNEAELWIELPNGARITLFGADNADSMRGNYFDGIVGDEIADWKPDVWNGIIRPALADRLGWALLIGTPKGMNELYKFYQRGIDKSPNRNPHWKSLLFPVTGTRLPWLPPEEVQALKDDMTDAMFAQEMLCDFQASGDNVLFKLNLMHACAMRQLRLSDIQGAAKVIGVDVAGAGKGSDRTIFQKKQGLMYWPAIPFKAVEGSLDITPQICDRLAQMMIEWGADAAIIDKGRGFAVVEEMQRRGFWNVYGIDFGGAPSVPQYANKKTEMAYRTVKSLKAGAKIPNDAELFEEASAHTVSLDEKGKLKTLEKDKVKEAIRRSPDKYDALILTNAFDVMPLDIHPFQTPTATDRLTQAAMATGAVVHGVHHQQVGTDFDPYKD